MRKTVEIIHEDPILRTFMMFVRVSQAVYKYSDYRLYQSNHTTTTTFVALKGLAANGGVMTHTELADWTNTKRHNITALVMRMKADGLITTERDRVDKRFLHIQITDKGRKLFEETSPIARDIMRQVMNGIGNNEAIEFGQLLRRIGINVNGYL